MSDLEEEVAVITRFQCSEPMSLRDFVLSHTILQESNKMTDLMKGSSRPQRVTAYSPRSLFSPYICSCSHSVFSGVKQFHWRISHHQKELCKMHYEICIKYGRNRRNTNQMEIEPLKHEKSHK